MVEDITAVSQDNAEGGALLQGQKEPSSAKSSARRAASRARSPRNPVGAELLPPAEVDARLETLRKKKSRRRRIALCLVLTDLVAIVLGFILANLLYAGVVNWPLTGRSLAVFVPIYYAIAVSQNVHNALVVESPAFSAWKVIAACAVTALAIGVVIFFLGASQYFSRQNFLVGASLSAALMGAGRWLAAILGRRYLGTSPYADLLIYDEVDGACPAGPDSVSTEQLNLHPDLNDMDFVRRLGELVEHMDKVTVHCRPERRAEWSRVLHCLDVNTELAWPELDEYKPIALRHRGDGVSLQITTGKLKWQQQFLKRTFDLACTIAILPGLLPVMAVVAIAIRLESRGPVFFRQTRIGLGNRHFTMLKFRSMYADRTDADAVKLVERNDNRVTRVGEFIRRTSLDELPQFFNVLKGDMSIVGPRPHALRALAGASLYWEVDESYWHRHVLKPGITGLAQIRGHRGNTFSEQHLRDRLKADLEYVGNWSLMGDLGIFLRTLVVALHKNAF